ncbi:MAG: exopolyphosphatase [Gammaproteobacteria bacterium]|jgi:exopolyphosphatase/guanosine-5'-triphosphate,3'-diphosphate pyrophosphatase
MTDSDSLSETPFLAAVDLGSNSFHMKLVRVVGDELEVIDRIREMVRLASGLDEHANLTNEAILRATDCLSRFGERLRDIPSNQVRVVGTNTLRRAGNARKFIRLAQRALGHPIEIIGGQEEARLVYLGVSHSVRSSDGRMLVVDIGGGSTELIIGSGYQPEHLESVNIGCVSLSLKFFKDGSITRKRMRKAITEGRLHLEPYEKAYRRIGWEQAIGSSGTIRTIEKVVIAQGWSDDGITPEALVKLQDALVKAGDIEALDLKGLGKDRAPVFPGGVAALSAVFEGLKINCMLASDGALREGLLYDRIGRTEHDSVREQSVTALMTRYQVDLEQAARVEETAVDCFSQLARSWKLDENENYRRCLIWAARLHEIGLAVAHSKYQKRGEYIVQYSDLLGFTRSEQQIVATLIRAHRYKFPSSVLAEFGEALVVPVMRLCIILRIAVLLRRGRRDEQLPEISVTAKSNKVQLKFPEGWLDQHALTRADLKQEKKYLKAIKVVLQFES